MGIIEPPRLITAIKMEDVPDSVPELLDLYKAKKISLKFLSDAFNTKVTWAFKGLTDTPGTWSSPNSWGTVWEAIGKKISDSDYLFLSQQYDIYCDEKERQAWQSRIKK